MKKACVITTKDYEKQINEMIQDLEIYDVIHTFEYSIDYNLDYYVHVASTYDAVFVMLNDQSKRKEILISLENESFTLPSLIHSSVYQKNLSLDEQVIIFAGCLIEEGVHIQKGCIIQENCKIGKNVHIEKYAFIESDVCIETQCYLGEACLIETGCYVGMGVHVQAGSHIASKERVTSNNVFSFEVGI